MPDRLPTSIVYLCGEETHGVISLVEKLLEQKIHRLGGGFKKLFALSDENVYDVINCFSSDRPLLAYHKLRSRQMCIGKNHSLLLGADGRVYVWGKGTKGELGLGSKISFLEKPVPVIIKGDVVNISSGDVHSCAVDSRGGLYSWGQNFDHQLGLYRKGQPNMPPGCCIERVMLVPKYVPFFYQEFIVQVSCGSRFTAAVTKVSCPIANQNLCPTLSQDDSNSFF